MLENNLNSLTLLRNILKDEVFAALCNYNQKNTDENFYAFLSAIYSHGAETDFCAYAADKILADENAYAICCAAGKQPSAYLSKAYARDINIIFSCINSLDERGFFEKGTPETPFDKYDKTGNLNDVQEFYRTHGYGQFIKHIAFEYDAGKLVPVKNPSAITLSQLKGYENEKKTIEENILNFLGGYPYNNMLLYGDRGTGKSSTIHAMLNKYSSKGLRIIEINKENMLDLPKIRQQIIENPLKFIIFIDDLSLNEYDDKISGLKAALEGSIAGNTSNTMIVATSNRRHIVKENFSDRENSVHVNDSMQEQLSLSDRFGITVLFSSTDKAQYLDIVCRLADDDGLKTPREELCALAERWALIKGGRSPRRARQFIDMAISCEKRGTDMDF